MSSPKPRTSLWPRDHFAAAVWESSLTPPQRLVALAYADHARDGSSAWVAGPRLQDRTGLGRTACAESVRCLVALGWLVPLTAPRKGHTAEYRLVIPANEKAVTRSSAADEKDATRSSTAPRATREGRQAASEGREAAQEGREAAPTSVPTSLPTSPAADGEPGQDRGEEDVEQRTAEARTVLAAALPPGASFTAKAAGHLAECVRKGWTPARLREVVAAPSWAGVGHAPSVLARRLADCAASSPPKAKPPRPAWCGTCHETTRRIESADDGADLGPCPRCHPTAAARTGP